MKQRDTEWWRRAVFYEIALISFQDSNGDGKGDLPGLLQRLDYLKWLGVDALWLTPIFRSPMLDLGYD
ncbi:MAG: alpha-amylase, partial [Hyphomicrobiales bacterium]|nr:alpha-amylase [Hyphomicrobiales bacterium]